MRSPVLLHVFNMLCQRTTTIYDGEQEACYKRVQWNANVSSGVYFYRIEATASNDPTKHFIDTKKRFLLK